MSDEALNAHLDWLDDCAREQSEHDPLDLAGRMFTLCDMADSEMVRQWAGEVRELLNEHALLEAKLLAIECGDCEKTMLECECDDLEEG